MTSVTTNVLRPRSSHHRSGGEREREFSFLSRDNILPRKTNGMIFRPIERFHGGNRLQGVRDFYLEAQPWIIPSGYTIPRIVSFSRDSPSLRSWTSHLSPIISTLFESPIEFKRCNKNVLESGRSYFSEAELSLRPWRKRKTRRRRRTR